METTPLLNDETNTDTVSTSPVSFRRRTPSNGGHSNGGPVRRIATQITELFSNNRSAEPESPTDADSIYSYLGESIIVSFLSAFCLITFPIALLAIYNSAQVDALIIRGKQRAAVGYARTAKILLIVSASGTVILYAAVFLLLLQLMKPI